MNCLYDFDKSFLDNVLNGPFYDGPFFTHNSAKSEWVSLFGKRVRSRIGVAACPITTTPAWIKCVTQLGYDIITYKTVASSIRLAHPHPNVAFARDVAIMSHDFNKRHNSLVNSIGNASLDLKDVYEGIAHAKSYLKEGQLLIVSVFGVQSVIRSLADDFAYVVARVKDAGADVVEANFSCPNVSCGVLSRDVQLVYEVTQKMVQQLKGTPLTIKVGAYQDPALMKNVLCAAARGGAQGITGINSIPVHAYNQNKQPFFGSKDRETCGLSGAALFKDACNFVRTAHKINTQEQLDLTILGTGGIVAPEDFTRMLKCGADAAMTATGAMLDAHLAMNYHNEQKDTYDTHRAKARSCQKII